MSLAQKRDAGTRRRVDLTSGPMIGRLIALALPLFIGNILDTAYNLADMFWVAKVGTDAVAAVAITFPTVWLTFSFGLGITIAGVAFVSQYTGARKPEEAARTAAQVVLLAMAAGAVLGGIGIAVRRPLLSLLGAEGAVLDLASTYLAIVLCALPINFIYYAYRAVSQSTGDSKTPRNLLLFTTLFNAAFDPFLILGWWIFPAWGVAGAAWATVISQFLGASVSLFLLMRGRLGVRVRLSYFKPDFGVLRRIVAVGTAGSLEMGARGMTAVIIAGVVSRFGTVEAAAYGIVMRVMSVVWTSSGAIEQATASAVGQNLGAAQPDRAERMAWTGAGLIFIFLSAVGALLFVFAEQIVGAFGVTDAVARTGARFMRLHVYAYGFWGAMEVLQGAFRGAGDTMPPALITFLARWVVHIPASIVTSYLLGWGADGAWIVMGVAYTAFSFITAAWFRGGRWKRGVVRD